MKKKILIVGLNWLGDSIMSMPALEAYHKSNPEHQLTVAVKPKLKELWQLVPHVAEIIEVQDGMGGSLRTAREIKKQSFEKAYIFPNSFRSALLPFAGAVPKRVGMPGHSRSLMLTDLTSTSFEKAGKNHQAWEYLDILGIDEPSGFPCLPRLSLPPASEAKAEELLVNERQKAVALIPGAAFGDSKRWPAEHFCELGRKVVKDNDASIIVLGAPSEADICGKIAADIGESAVSVAGKTSLADMVAVLERCSYAVSNDCGGMHVAAAAGVKIIAVFGLTDPLKTGPLGNGHKIVTPEGIVGSRDIAKNSSEARQLLASISPDRVYAELRELFADRDGDS